MITPVPVFTFHSAIIWISIRYSIIVKSIPALQYFLNEYEIEEVDVPQSKTGVFHVKSLEQENEIAGGVQVIQYDLPSCGGVTIRIEPEDEDYTENQDLNEKKNQILNARNNNNPAWNF